VTAGSVLIDGVDVTDDPPRRRDIAMVFQSYALYPHMSVRRNMAYGLRVRRTPKDEADRRVERVARMLGLEELLERRPGQLSGGQRQRVAMGRAIVRDPKAFLMDEPLSNLDAKMRVSMRASLAQLHAQLGVTTVYVTHDQTEAMTLGQRVAVMRDGKIVQVDRPQRLYEAPTDLFVAAFIGSPAMNLVEAVVTGDEVEAGDLRLPLSPLRRPQTRSGRVALGIRPEAFQDAEFAPPDWLRTTVRLDVVEELGAESHAYFRVRAPRVAAGARDAAESDTLLADDSTLFTARIDQRTRAHTGGDLVLAIDPSRFHFFDLETGATLLADQAAVAEPVPA
jgi:multiple sugar transport system ATP-binding protein